MAASARAALSLSLSLLLPLAAAYLPLPEYVQPCSLKQSDRRLSECAVQSARKVMPAVLKGDENYKIPVLDPLYLDRLVVIDGKGPLAMQLTASDVNLYGIPDIIINSTTFQTKERVTTYVATLPKVHILAKYNITGRILLLPIVGKGNVVMNLTNVELIYQYKWNLKRLEDGEVYYVPEPGARLDLDAQGMTILLDNLFNGDKALLDTTNKFLNDEWREVFDSLQPSFASAISEVITSILNGIFTRVRQQDAWLGVDPESFKIPWINLNNAEKKKKQINNFEDFQSSMKGTVTLFANRISSSIDCSQYYFRIGKDRHISL